MVEKHVQKVAAPGSDSSDGDVGERSRDKRMRREQRGYSEARSVGRTRRAMPLLAAIGCMRGEQSFILCCRQRHRRDTGAASRALVPPLLPAVRHSDEVRHASTGAPANPMICSSSLDASGSAL